METTEITGAGQTSDTAPSTDATARAAGPTRFSLRGLLLMVTTSAVLLGAWRLLGLSWSFTLLFALVSVMPLLIPRLRWKPAYAAAWAAVYGPFVGMALYTLAYVPCNHCKAATWNTLPFGPAFVPIQWGRSLLNLSPPSELMLFGLSFVFSIFAIPALTWLVYHRGWVLRSIVLTIIVAFNTLSAIVLLAMIRM